VSLSAIVMVAELGEPTSYPVPASTVTVTVSLLSNVESSIGVIVARVVACPAAKATLPAMVL
jgi:hypothetical protein